MSGCQDGASAALSDEELAEYHRGMLRFRAEGALEELQKIASGTGSDANGAALALVGVAIAACERVRAAVVKNPSAFSPFAQQMTKWPVTHSVFPGNREGLADYLSKLKLGTNAPLNLRKWRLTAPGTRWAVAYWLNVQSCWAHRDFERKAGRCGGVDDHLRLFDGRQALRADYDEAVKLPCLTAAPAILQQWKDAFDRHVQRHFADYGVVDEPDWKHLRTYRIGGKSVDLQWAYGKFLGEVERGFGRIAKRSKPV